MKKIIKNIAVFILPVIVISSCHKDLDRLPTNDITSEQVYSNAQGYLQAFAKVYGAFALTNNSGPNSTTGDIQGINVGFSDFYRLFWQAEELPTDEAVISWGDIGIQDFHNMNWSANNPFLQGLYYRSFYQITLCNDFIRQASDDKVSSRGITGTDAENIKTYRTEARFLRALQYWVVMDLYGNVPFVTENDALGSTIPAQIQRKDLFAYIETELLDIQSQLPAPKTNQYGRADQAASWALLARLYLNAEVYTGTARYNDAVVYSKKVIDAGYSLENDYTKLMRADNNVNNPEFIFTINYDGKFTQGYGGSTFLVHASVGDNMNPGDFGVDGGWFGLRTTKNLPELFPDFTGTKDKRAQFVQNNLDINDLTKFSDGFAVTKYRNVTKAGAPGSDKTFADTDIPLFRLGEMYLIFAEATLRGGTGGDDVTALQYINALRTRAYGDNSGNISASDLTLDFILDERARELYWEGFRRTDLIRYGRFTEGSYLWPWKGGVKLGRAVEDFRKLYPLPASDIVANPNLQQNTGY